MNVETGRVEQLSRLPDVEPAILGLQMGKVRRDNHDKPQVYLGGNRVEHLTPHDQVTMREGAIHVDMYTIDGRDDVDFAEITIQTPASQWSANRKGQAYRGKSGRTDEYIERTPVQYFYSRRGFMDFPISGRAIWLAMDPEGTITEGVFDDNYGHHNQVAYIGEGWTFCWIVQSMREFKFGELCSPRFIDQAQDYPRGEEGITELEPEELTGEFKERFDYYMAGGQPPDDTYKPVPKSFEQKLKSELMGAIQKDKA